MSGLAEPDPGDNSKPIGSDETGRSKTIQDEPRTPGNSECLTALHQGGAGVELGSMVGSASSPSDGVRIA